MNTPKSPSPPVNRYGQMAPPKAKPAPSPRGPIGNLGGFAHKPKGKR